MLRPLPNNSIACSTSTCAESIKMAISGNSSRITRAASSPSVLWVGGIRMSATTKSGVLLANQREQLPTVTGLPHHIEPRTVQQAGQTLPKQQIVIGHHHPHRDHHLLPGPHCRPERRGPLYHPYCTGWTSRTVRDRASLQLAGTNPDSAEIRDMNLPASWGH